MSNLPPSGEIPRGAIRFNTDSNKPELWDGSQWAEFQLSTPNLGRGVDSTPGARGFFAGGFAPGNYYVYIDSINIASTGSEFDFGDLNVAAFGASACASSTRALQGMKESSPGWYSAQVDAWEISSLGQVFDFGDLHGAKRSGGSGGNQTRGLFFGGQPGGGSIATTDLFTISSTGSRQDFGNMSTTLAEGFISGISSPTRTIAAGGGSSKASIYATIPTTGTWQDFGDGLTGGGEGSDGGCSSATRGLFGGVTVPGGGGTNTIEYITITSLGKFADFGDLSQARRNTGACSSKTRGVWGGGRTPTYVNTIDYVEITTFGNAVDFGDLGRTVQTVGGTSNAHGGL